MSTGDLSENAMPRDAMEWVDIVKRTSTLPLLPVAAIAVWPTLQAFRDSIQEANNIGYLISLLLDKYRNLIRRAIQNKLTDLHARLQSARGKAIGASYAMVRENTGKKYIDAAKEAMRSIYEAEGIEVEFSTSARAGKMSGNVPQEVTITIEANIVDSEKAAFAPSSVYSFEIPVIPDEVIESLSRECAMLERQIQDCKGEIESWGGWRKYFSVSDCVRAVRAFSSDPDQWRRILRDVMSICQDFAVHMQNPHWRRRLLS